MCLGMCETLQWHQKHQALFKLSPNLNRLALSSPLRFKLNVMTRRRPGTLRASALSKMSHYPMNCVSRLMLLTYQPHMVLMRTASATDSIPRLPPIRMVIGSHIAIQTFHIQPCNIVLVSALRFYNVKMKV